MNITIDPSRACGKAKAPPSKSCAHRLLLCAALAEGESEISGISDSQDMLATLDCISALGARYEKSGDTVRVWGMGEDSRGSFPCRESGSTLRFLIPVALTRRSDNKFTGTSRLMTRGVGIYEEIFREKGVSFTKGLESLEAKGLLQSGNYSFRGDVSSQFVSGLMFALPLLRGNSTVKVLPPVESRAYIDLTIQILAMFGVQISEPEKNLFCISGSQRYQPAKACAEGDWSNAAFLLAFNELGGEVELSGLSESSLQSDRACVESFARLREKDAAIDISGCPDLGPVLFAVAAAKNGGAFTGTARLRIKESDRAAAMAEELRKFGAAVTVAENSVTVRSHGIHPPTRELRGHNDHRIVMALSVLASMAGGTIQGAEAISKSFPDFFGVLRELGVEVHGEI